MARGKVIREFQNPGVAGAQNITFKKVNEESGKIDYTCSDKNAEMAELFEYFAVQFSFRTTIRSLKVTQVLCTYPC